MNIILEAIDAPPPGWSGRRRYIATQLFRVVVQAAGFVLVLVAIGGGLFLVAAATDALR